MLDFRSCKKSIARGTSTSDTPRAASRCWPASSAPDCNAAAVDAIVVRDNGAGDHVVVGLDATVTTDDLHNLLLEAICCYDRQLKNRGLRG
jgi:hypothetical protein